MHYGQLYRTTQGKMIGGVAAGIADYFSLDPIIIRILFVVLLVFGGLADRFGIDPTVMRVACVVLVVITSGAAIPAYLLYALLVPVEEIELPVEKRIIII